MELLHKRKGRGALGYVLAYLLLVVTFVTGWGALNRLRLSLLVLGGAITPDGRWLRVLNMVTWVLLVIGAAVYGLVLEHAYRDAVTRARVRSARLHSGVPEPKSKALRFLRPYDLDMLGAVFARFFGATVVAFILLFGLHWLLSALLPG